jgi:hypothetical protein
MPKQRTPGRSNKHMRKAKLLITAFAISATIIGCAALNARSDAQALFAPAISVDIGDLATPDSGDSLRLTVTNHMISDDERTPTQPPHRSIIQMR